MRKGPEGPWDEAQKQETESIENSANYFIEDA